MPFPMALEGKQHRLDFEIGSPISFPMKIIVILGVCVCVCVCVERERQRERERERESGVMKDRRVYGVHIFFSISFKNVLMLTRLAL